MNNRHIVFLRALHRIAALLLLGWMVPATASAQVISPYTFQSGTAQYTELPTTGIVKRAWDGTGQALLGLGDRTFRFFGHEVDFGDAKNYIGLLDGGELIIGRDTLQFTLPAFLAGLRSRDNSSSISHGVYSYLDDSVYVVQWKNAGFLSGDSANYVNFQIWLYMGSGVIEYRYGPRRVVGTDALNGDSGPAVGVVISDQGIRSWYSSLFLTGPSTGPSAAPDAFFPTLTSVPTNGTIYRFIPAPVASVGATRQGLHDLQVYPNPVHDRLTISHVGRGDIVRIYDMLGRMVAEHELTGDASTLDLRSLPAGIYHLEIRSGTERHTVTIHRQ